MAENQKSTDKKRKSNFTESEISVLLRNIRKHYKILYGQDSKRYDNRTLRYRAWMDIVKRVNEVSCEKRTLEEIKNKWKKCQHKEKVMVWEELAPMQTLTMKTKHKTKVRHMRTTRTLNSYDPDFKKAVILYAEQKGTREAKRAYGVSESNIRRWRSMKNDIYDQSEKKKTTHQIQKRSSARNSVRKSYAMEPTEEMPAASEPVGDPLEANDNDNSDSIDSMPLQQRLSHSPEASSTSSSQPVLQSQPLSPTKLKVTRQSIKSAAAAAAASQPLPEPPKPEPLIQAEEEVCLRWNTHHSNMQTAFPSLLMKEQYVDVTLVAEGQTLKCHRMILSSCSSYFEEILEGITPYQHPVLFMKDIPFWLLKSLCDYMYAGEVHICQNKLGELLAVAETLKIKGLAGQASTNSEEQQIALKEEKRVEKKIEKKMVENKLEGASKNYSSKSSSKSSSKHEDKHKRGQLEKYSKITMDKYNRSQDDNKYTKVEEDEVDPLDLLEPFYEEIEQKKSASTPQPIRIKEVKNIPVKKNVPKKIKKRKYSDHEPSPPPVFHFRKGTRSRPNVKIPKYYHNDFANENAGSLDDPQPSTSMGGLTDPLFDIGQIKTEPLDIDDNIVIYSDDEPMMAPVLQGGDTGDSFDVDVVEHSLAEQSAIEMSIVDTSCTDLEETNPLDETNPFDESNPLEESNVTGSQLLEQSDLMNATDSLEITPVVNELPGSSKLDDAASDGFQEFKKISLVSHPIITEVRSLIDEPENKVDTGPNTPHISSRDENQADGGDKVETDTPASQTNEDSHDPLNIASVVSPDLENTSSQDSTAAKSDKLVEYSQNLEATDDSQTSQDVMGHIESFGTVLSPDLPTSESDTQQLTTLLQDTTTVECGDNDQSASEATESVLEGIKIQSVQSLSDQLLPAEEPTTSDPRVSPSHPQADEFPSDMPVLEPMVLEQSPKNHDISLEAPNITNSDVTIAEVEADVISNVTNAEPDVSRLDVLSSAHLNEATTSSEKDLPTCNSTAMDTDDGVPATTVVNSLDVDAPKESDNTNLDVISEIEKTIELLGGRSKTEKSNVGELNSMDSFINQEFDDVPMADAVTSDSDLLNESLSDRNDSNVFSMETQPIASSDQYGADLLADT